VGRIERDRVACRIHTAFFAAEDDAKREVVGVDLDDLVVAVRREATNRRVGIPVIPGRGAIPEAMVADLERFGRVLPVCRADSTPIDEAPSALLFL
jgi:hypothetical protein